MKKDNRRFYFTTREMVLMAAFAAVGGIASTYINMIGDFFQSLLGFAGTTQWAAGLHVMWLVFVAVMIKKPGAASTTGILKGGVEFLTGNTHGILVLIVDIVAGIVIDIVFLLNPDKKFNLWAFLAAGLSSASNIVVFQFFAAIPADTLTFLAIGLASGGAFLSGFLFGGVLVRSILLAVEKAGIYHPPELISRKGRIVPGIIITVAIIAVLFLGWQYMQSQSSSDGIRITGDVNNPIQISPKDVPAELISVSATLNDVSREYKGYRLSKLIEEAQPYSLESIVLLRAFDGYSYFLTMEEINENPSLILSLQEVGESVLLNVVGAESPKAWVRGLEEILITERIGVKIEGAVNSPYVFYPEEFQTEMDSTYLPIGDVERKLQGVPLISIIEYANPTADYRHVKIESKDGSRVMVEANAIREMGNELRLFAQPEDDGLYYVVGKMNGEILSSTVVRLMVE